MLPSIAAAIGGRGRVMGTTAPAPNVVIVPFACNTTTGAQFIQKSGWGRTPAAALFFVSGATALGATVTNGALLGFGFTNGSTHNATGWRWGHNGTPSNADRVGDQAAVIVLPSDGGIDGEAAFVSFAANGISINWTNAPAAAYRGVVVLIASDIVTASAVDHFDPVTGNNDRTLGLSPDLILTTHLGASSWVGDADARGGFGAWSSDSDNQAAIGFFGDDGDNPADVGIELSRTRCSIRQWLGGTTGHLVGDGASVANGIRLVGTVITSNHEVGLLALQLSKSIKIVTAPAIPAAGDWEIMGIGFKPEAGIIVQSLSAAFDTGYTGGESGTMAFSIGFFDTDSQACLGVQAEDAVNPSNTSSLARVDRVQDLRDDVAASAGDMADPVRDNGTLTVAAADISSGTGAGVGWAILFGE